MKFIAGIDRKVSVKEQQRIYERFVVTGSSGTHSRFGLTLAPLLNRLTQEGISFRPLSAPGGYFVERVDG